MTPPPPPRPVAAAYSAPPRSSGARAETRAHLAPPGGLSDPAGTEEATVGEEAKSYGLTAGEYRTNNLLGVEITSGDVAAVIVALCSPVFAKTTGAQIPIDGGNDCVV